MGAWGPGIFQNDISEDVRFEYKTQLKLGKSDEIALSQLMLKFTEEINDDEGKYDFWFSLASVLYDMGRLTENIKNFTLDLIENCETDLERWNTVDKNKRKKEIKKLKNKLSLPIPERKKISLAKPFYCKWKINDVFYCKFDFNESDLTTQNFKYVIILVEDLVVHDVAVEGLGDILPITLIKLSENLPSSLSDVDNALFLTHYFNFKGQNQLRFMWYRNNFRAFEKKLCYLGNFNFYVPDYKCIASLTTSSSDHADLGIFPNNFENKIKCILEYHNNYENKYYNRYLINGLNNIKN